MIINVTTGLSTTVKSAQSKKCRMLSKVRNGQMNAKVALAIRDVDPMLADVMTEADVLNAAAGLMPSRGGGHAGIKLTIEI
jgi:hypothetical protein